MLIIFKLTKCREYFKSVSIFLAHVAYLERENHPVFFCMVHSLGSFVEELGECAFGMMSSSSSRNPSQEEFESVRQSWKLLHTFNNISSTFTSMSSYSLEESTTIHLSDTSPESVLLQSYLAIVAEKIKLGSFQVYDSLAYKKTIFLLLPLCL